MHPQNSDTLLTRAEIDFFVANGYLGPYAAMTPEEMAAVRREIEEKVLATDGPSPRTRAQSRHMDQPVIYDLATHRAVIDRITGILGPDLVVWATQLWLKPPGGAEIPWHQDINFWPLEPPINTSAWLAIDDVTVENSCVQIIPGSHRESLSHIKVEHEMAFGKMADPDSFVAEGALNMELRPGEFFIFSERLLHRSSKNTSNKRRLGLSIRVTLPLVHVFQDDSPLHPGHTAILARGKDAMGFNRYAGRP